MRSGGGGGEEEKEKSAIVCERLYIDFGTSEEASRLTSVFSEQTVQPGRSVYLHCFATGNPWTGAAASISWSVDSLMMPYTSGR